MARKSLTDGMATPGDRDWLASSGPAGKPKPTPSPLPFGTHHTVLMGDDGNPASDVPFTVEASDPAPVKPVKAKAPPKPKPVVENPPDWGTW